jgi:hypothetical protein
LFFILWQSGGGRGEVPTENLVFYNLLQNIIRTFAKHSTLLFILWQSGGGRGEVPTENLVFYNLLQNIIRTFAKHSTLFFILWQSGGGRGEVPTENLVFYNLLQNIIRCPKERERIVTHPLIESFINFKWRRIQKIIQFQVKQKTKFSSYIRTFRWDRLQSHI